MKHLRSRNDYALAEEIEIGYLRSQSPGQTMQEFLFLFDSFRQQMVDDGQLDTDDHRSALIALQARLGKLKSGSTPSLA